MQNYLNYIARTYSSIPTVEANGIFGQQTTDAVSAFQQQFGLPGRRGTVNSITWNAITDVYEDLYLGATASEGQFPGYTVE